MEFYKVVKRYFYAYYAVFMHYVYRFFLKSAIKICVCNYFALPLQRFLVKNY